MQSPNFSNLIAILFTFLFAKVLCAPQDELELEPGSSIRYCGNTAETFFNDVCLPIGSTEYCPRNMQLFDGSDSNGFCDCVDIDRPAFYSEKTNECSFHHTQGPCMDGEWFVIKSNTPQCEPVPEGCPADGQHVYWGPGETKQCWKIGSQGPCTEDEILTVEEGAGELRITCQFPIVSSISFYPGNPCRLGTRRNKFNKCAK